MGQESRRRREARRRSNQRPGADGIAALLDLAVRHAVHAPATAGPHIRVLHDLGAAPPVVDEVVARIGAAWEQGWQPRDLLHASRRHTTAAATRWLSRAILVESHRSGAPHRAPRSWLDQLDVLESSVTPAADELLPSTDHPDQAAWLAALVTLDLLRGLPRVRVVDAVPSQWDRLGRPSTVPETGRIDARQAKALTTVRALLAKAESTDFAAEAEAFTAKAQSLMTRHALDEALITADIEGGVVVRARRILVHHPYPVEKASLLDQVARANRTRAVWDEFASSVTVVGVPTDLDQVEMLFTSTLVQATRAMTHAGQAADSAPVDRSSSFRKSFLVAYAQRIGQRLTVTAEEATASYGSALVPVLARQGEAVTAEFERLFPRVTTTSRRRSYDRRGWDAGTRAADDTVLPSAMLE
ncbi:hypothetical protein HMPREF0063_10811 [Aeromicrobium marinum DSM 15272]|uniref:DUF2786 domain-containing protein n=1 Tax=Aeromicrobium marinum DSM 15272 TaxID=585531 RepID=E2SA21_9ACTN|nr:DUF2786 domain-containing protein [Aeromicrobium marinum]EFQ84095.1 hypothetical protein HMPREF0063_10811 [Aeromicrobium marinum DSM 15272]